MNYLIVLPRFVDKVGDFYFFPLGIAYISASLKKANKNVATLNLNQTDRPVEEVIAEAIEEQKIDVLLTGGLSGNYKRVQDILLAAKKTTHKIMTVVGGGLVSSEPFVVMEGLSADIGVIGEGEITVCELADALEKNEDLARVDGLIYRRGGKLQLTRPRKEILDLGSIAWPDYEGFGYSAYLDTLSKIPGNNRYVQMIASRSCPFDCTFCYHPIGKKYRQRSLDEFFRELDFMLSHFRIEYLSISDELFSVDHHRTLAFCERMKDRAATYGIKWDIQLRAESVDRELLKLLKSSGCHLISYGIESADNSVLKSMRKHTTIEQIENALRLTTEAGIEIQGNFIFGDIEETVETANRTLEWWKNHLEYQVNLTFIRVFPGTHLYRYACDRGIIKNKLNYLQEGCPLINISKMNEKEFKELQVNVDSYLKKYSQAPHAVKILGVKGSGCHISIVCGRCRKTSEQIGHPFSPNLSATRAFCPHCKQRMYLDDAVFHELFEKGFQRLIHSGRTIAVWGCGDIAQKLFEKSKCLRETPLFLVDKKGEKQGTDFWGHKVMSPSIIPGQKVDTIIIASIMYAAEIAKEISEKYPGVNKIIHLLDLETIVDEKHRPASISHPDNYRPYIILNTTQRCNYRCRMCFWSRPDVARNLEDTDPTMPMDLFQRALEETVPYGRSLCLAGAGEFLADPFRSERLSILGETLHSHPQVMLYQTSNASLLTADRLQFLKGVQKVGFTLSIDSVDALTYASIRRPGTLSKVQENIRRLRGELKALGVQEVHIRLNVVVMKRNIFSLPDVLRFAKEIHAAVYIDHPQGFGPDDLDQESLFRFPAFSNSFLGRCGELAKQLNVEFQRPPDFAIHTEEVEKYYKAAREKNLYCYQLNSEGPIQINANGDVSVCCQNLVFGNLYQQSFREIFFSPHFGDYRQAIAEGQPLSPCDHCRHLYRVAPYLYESSVYDLNIPPECRNLDPQPDLEKEGFLNWIDELSEKQLRHQLQQEYLAKGKRLLTDGLVEELNSFQKQKARNEKFASWIRERAKIIVYPAGGEAAWLLQNTLLSQVNIVGFSDHNPLLHGKDFHGYKVYAPAEIPRLKPDILLVASELYQNQIYKDLAHLQVNGTKIFTL